VPKTRSIPSWTTSVFSSTVTDFVLIYEPVTSSASVVVRWLTLHRWTLNFWILFYENDDCLTNADWLTNQLRVFLYLGANRIQNATSTTRTVLLCSCVNYTNGEMQQKEVLLVQVWTAASPVPAREPAIRQELHRSPSGKEDTWVMRLWMCVILFWPNFKEKGK
jgi:hypothetical protein